MISSKADKIKARLLEFAGLMSFNYHGIDCDIDPFNLNLFHICCDGKEQDVHSIDEVMALPLFHGACLNDIAEEIDVFDW